ncbi:MAG TPA: hypothetical protein ENK23_06805, partial [Sorangium sp.]|nr:hypothetical protein [Sorangium sp.]
MKKRATLLVITAALAVTWSACGEATPESMKAVSYNVGLAVGFVKAAESRAPLAIEQIAALDADVVCVQEVWLPRH